MEGSAASEFATAPSGCAECLSMPLSALATRLSSVGAAEDFSPFAGIACVLADVDLPASASACDPPPCPVVAVAASEPVNPLVDVAAPSVAAAEQAAEAACRQPVAALALVQLLRHNARANVPDGVFAESLAYSTLQHGAGFRAWLAERRQRPPRTTAPAPTEPPVLVARDGDSLRITLNRPAKRNAYSTALRDGLCEALAVAVEDPSIVQVVLAGAGACFSAGGDLDEFGAARDAGLAHAARMTRSAGILLYRLRDRAEARLHGACIGAGIELPAFVGRVIARPDAFFQLPEVGMGLIPGAGGTASILARIGRQRLGYMALSGARIDAATACAWGLVDAVEAWA